MQLASLMQNLKTIMSKSGTGERIWKVFECTVINNTLHLYCILCFSDTLIRFTMINAPPSLTVPKNNPNLAYGIQLEIVREIQKVLQFQTELMVPETGSFGSIDETGNWNGMMAQLMDNVSDVSLVLQFIKERAQVIDFTHVIFNANLVLVTKRKDMTTVVSFVSMLQVNVWIMSALVVFAFFVLTLAILWIFQRYVSLFLIIP